MSDTVYRRGGLIITRYWNGKEQILQFDYRGSQLDIPLHVFPDSIIKLVTGGK